MIRSINNISFNPKMPSMLNHIKNKFSKEFFTSERCHISELLNDATSPQLSMARCRVEIGVTTQLHALKGVRETYLIEKGEGVMDDGGNSEFSVEAGDSVEIAPDHPQRIRNTGDSDLIFMVVCKPRFTPDCYLALGE